MIMKIVMLFFESLNSSSGLALAMNPSKRDYLPVGLKDSIFPPAKVSPLALFF